MLLLFSASLSAQCPESSTPTFAPEHEPRTLCQKYSPPGKFPNRFGTATTYLASQIIWILNNGNDVFTGDIDLVGDLEIDQDFTLLNCKVRISPNVRIRVNADVTFTLDGSKLFCCQEMWQGIDLDYYSTIVSRNITEIEDALVAMESPCTATLSIRNTVFNRNIVGIRLGYDGPVPNHPCHTLPVFSQFSGNTFDCNAPLNGTINGVSFVGVQVYKTQSTIGALTSALSTFRNIQFGIRFETQWWGTSMVNRCRFEGVLNDGIFMAQGNLTVDRSEFFNCGFRGINAETIRGLTVQRCNFNFNDDVSEQINGPNIYRHIQAAGISLFGILDINHNFFGCSFSDLQKIENGRGIEIIGDATMGGNANLTIEWNEFDFSVSGQNLVNNALILLTGEFPSGNSTNIEFNTCFLDQPASVLGDMYIYGILLENGTKNSVEIYSNTLNSGTAGDVAGPTTDFGIGLWGSMGNGNVVSGNVFGFNPNTAHSTNFYSGIFASDFINTVFCSNSLRESSYPMYFQGVGMGTQYFTNSHTGGGRSFSVVGGFIGEQGIAGGEHNGNTWYDKWNNIIPVFHAYHLPPELAPNSHFLAHTPQSVRTSTVGYSYFSEFHPADINPDIADEWFTPDFSGYPGMGDCITHIIGTGETDKAIAGGTIDALVQNPTHIWTGRRYLYAKLMQNPTLQNVYTEFGTFLSAQSQTSVGQLYAVEQKIAEGLIVSATLEAQLGQIISNEALAKLDLISADSILDTASSATELASALSTKWNKLGELQTLDSLYGELFNTFHAATISKLQEALVLNNQVIANYDYEQYEKTVNDISIQQALNQNGLLTVGQIGTLQSIAILCPKVGGHGVYRARGLLSLCDAPLWNDNSANCYELEAPVQEQVLENAFSERATAKIVGDQLIVYPNPATAGFFVRVPTRTSGIIILSDGVGKVWRTVSFASHSESQFVDVPNLPAGIYFCTVATSNGDRQVTKVILTAK